MLYNKNIAKVQKQRTKGDIMQLGREELQQVFKILNIVLEEAQNDYSEFSKFAVVNISGNTITLNKHQISVLHKFLEGGI
jgi:hypothetical protein